jgi:hypothetical protein
MLKGLVAIVGLTLALAGMIIGCSGSSNPMVGTWKLQLEDSIAKMMPPGKKMEVTANFSGDNTFSMTMDAGDRVETVSGEYALNDKVLTLTPKMEGGKPSDDKPETVTLSDDMKTFPLPGGSGNIGKMVKQ